jgi:hypothetical protein
MTVTRSCTFFQRRQRSTNPVCEVRAHRGERCFSDAADFRSEPEPTKIPGPADERPFKAAWVPHTSSPNSRYPLTHSQWLQDLLPALSAKPPGNWLLLLPRSAPLSLPFALASQLPPRPLSPPTSSRPVVSRQLTLPAPRRPSTVILSPALSPCTQKLTIKQSVPTGPRRSFLCVNHATMALKLVSVESRADN